MEELTNNPWLAAGVVFITQVIFLFFRTLNVMYTAEKRILASILTGSMIGIAWLVSIAIGANAIMELQWQPIVGHLIGGALGTYWGLLKRNNGSSKIYIRLSFWS